MTYGFFEALDHHLYGGGIQMESDDLQCEICGCIISEFDRDAHERFHDGLGEICSECYQELYEEEEEDDE